MTIAKSQTTGTIKTETSAIATLESEIETRSVDIERLREAIDTLEAGKLRPIDPKTDSAFALLVEMVGAAPENLEQQQIYQAKLQAARQALKLATEVCQKKQIQLKVLQQQKKTEQADVLLQELLTKAEKYNAAIDSSFELLEQMKTLNSQIGRLRDDRLQVFEIRSDLAESSYCEVGSNRVVVRRRFDLKR